MPEVSAAQWAAFTNDQHGVHLLQTAPWGELKAAFGWQVAWLQRGDCGTQILFRKLPGGFSLAYIPKGPIGQGWPALLPEIDALCRRRRAVFLKMEPDLWVDGDEPAPPQGFSLSQHAIQPLRTLVLDLSVGEEALLAQMKQKTRYNIRLAAKKGVVVRPDEDVQAFYDLMTATGSRDGFGIHSLAYYQKAYQLFAPSGMCQLLVAEYEGQCLAALMVFFHQGRAWYFYGASSNDHRNLMPTYLLQWEAIRQAIQRGCYQYDLWGVPDEVEEVLEAGFQARSDGLWSVYRFKRGFGGQLRRAAGPWDRVYLPPLYALYRWWAGRAGNNSQAAG
jgi:peptidoglycan pentaglycine glycine transferase (the first glycine)